ncbi:MAG: hypothetical protein LBO21_09605 [Synergistaceae bacterium]|nr:hypothetical protein [Synergistaceae bacterium]
MASSSGDDNKGGFRGPKSRADLLRKLASGDESARRGHVVTRDFMNSRKSSGMIEIVDTGISPPVSPVDAVLYDVIKRLKRMRDIAEAAAALPVSGDERARMQDEINQCRDEINDLSNLLSDAEKLEEKMSVNAPATPAADMVGKLLNDALQDGQDDESPSQTPMDDEKIASWMKSIMKGWGTPEGGQNGNK